MIYSFDPDNDFIEKTQEKETLTVTITLREYRGLIWSACEDEKKILEMEKDNKVLREQNDIMYKALCKLCPELQNNMTNMVDIFLSKILDKNCEDTK